MTEEEQELATIIELQSKINTRLYELVSTIRGVLLDEITEQQTWGIIVSSLSTNLGLVLAQLPNDMKDEYHDVSIKIINASLVNTLERADIKIYGNVGHA